MIKTLPTPAALAFAAACAVRFACAARFAFAAVAATATTAMAADADNMKAFPPAEPGMIRYVIRVPKLPDEYSARLELLVGKTVNTDRRNRYFFGGRLEKETIKGWGFDRYVLRELGPMAGTLMAVDPNEPKVDRFVTLGGEQKLVRYNSRLPAVVYVPEGVEVRYRIWRADPAASKAEPG
jgi:ecotin